jgi:hypothetical protein
VCGELLANHSERDSEVDWLYRPAYCFSDVHGQMISTSSSLDVSVVRRLEIGQVYDLRYDPADSPRRARQLVGSLVAALSALGSERALLGTLVVNQYSFVAQEG